jgi:hypothetical protein
MRVTVADDAAFPDTAGAFPQDPSQPSAFGDVDAAAQNQAQISQGFTQNRSLRNYIQAISKGASAKPGATRASISGGLGG